jgi:hypothetical protein
VPLRGPIPLTESRAFFYLPKAGDSMGKEKKQSENAFNMDDVIRVKNEIVENSRNDQLKNNWSRTKYFLSGEMLLYQDRTGKWRPIKGGMTMPNGLVINEESVINYPKDPHIITIANGLTSKSLGNPLIPQALPFSKADSDKDTAQKVTNFLMYHRDKVHEDRQTDGVSMREEIIEWIKATGNAFIKDYFNTNTGKILGINDNGEQLFAGEIISEVVPTPRMIIPNGIAKFKDFPYIGEMVVMHVDKIYEKYGVKVEPDKDLISDGDLDNWGDSGEDTNNKLKDHALVYELYLYPSDKYPKGRMIVCTKDRPLYSGLYDAKLADSDYGKTDWHPYSHAGWIRSAGQFWCKSMLEYLIPHQIALNKQWKRLLEDDKNFKGWWLSQQGAVDWQMVRNAARKDGVPNIQYKNGYERPVYQAPPPINTDSLGKINLIVQRMNDILSQYEVTRGNADPNVTSGRQADVMNSASNSQATPLLTAIVSIFISHWKKVLHLAAVHFEPEGREIRFRNPDTEEISSFIFTPDMIKSDDITIFGGNAFYETPDMKQQRIQQMAAMGYFGDIKNDPVARKGFLKLLEMPNVEEAFDSQLNDINMAKRENEAFKQMKIYEDRPSVIMPVLQKYQADLQNWYAAKASFMRDLPIWQKKMTEFNQLAPLWQAAKEEYERLSQAVAKRKEGNIILPQNPGPPPEMPGRQPVDPGPLPEMPKPYRRAKHYEDHQVHIEEHRSWRKTPEYEQLCYQFPELDLAMDFHEFDHLNKMREEMETKQNLLIPQMSIPPGPAPQAGPAGPPNLPPVVQPQAALM